MFAVLSDILLSTLDVENIIQFIYRRQFAITFILIIPALIIYTSHFVFLFYYPQNTFIQIFSKFVSSIRIRMLNIEYRLYVTIFTN